MAKADISSFRGEQFSLVGLVTRGVEGSSSTTTAAVEPGATTIPVVSTTGFPSAGIAEIAGALILYTGTGPTSLTGVPASGNGSIPEAIAAGARVSAMNAVDVRGATSLTFTAKRTRGGTSVVSKAVGSGVTISSGVPGSAYSIAIAAGDTSAFTKTELLSYEVRLVEADGTATVLTYGTWMVELGAS